MEFNKLRHLNGPNCHGNQGEAFNSYNCERLPDQSEKLLEEVSRIMICFESIQLVETGWF